MRLYNHAISEAIVSDKSITPRRDSLADYPWGKIIIGLILGGAVFYLHNLFTDLETGAVQSARLNVIIIFLYETIGHMPTIIVIGVVAVIFFIMGVRQLFTERRDS
jgi:hypothetical protein